LARLADVGFVMTVSSDTEPFDFAPSFAFTPVFEFVPRFAFTPVFEFVPN
jgi:hypothetical protein